MLQEELKITYLAFSVLVEEEMRNQELELKLKLERLLAYEVRNVLHSNAEGIYDSSRFCYLLDTWVKLSVVLPNSSLTSSHHSGVFCRS